VRGSVLGSVIATAPEFGGRTPQLLGAEIVE